MAALRLAEGEFLAADIGPIEETRGQEAEAFSLVRAVLSQRSPSVAAPFRPVSHSRAEVLADAIASVYRSTSSEGKTSWRPMTWSCVWKRFSTPRRTV
jgi:hypothetical protein